jgi:uncharacterized protein YjiS (DUF1127 family)
MRDYVYKQSQFRTQTYSWSSLRAIFRNWVNRRALSDLERLTDHELKDIGLTRGDLYYLQKLPVTADPVWEMERLRVVASRRQIRPDNASANPQLRLEPSSVPIPRRYRRA